MPLVLVIDMETPDTILLDYLVAPCASDFLKTKSGIKTDERKPKPMRILEDQLIIMEDTLQLIRLEASQLGAGGTGGHQHSDGATEIILQRSGNGGGGGSNVTKLNP